MGEITVFLALYFTFALLTICIFLKTEVLYLLYNKYAFLAVGVTNKCGMQVSSPSLGEDSDKHWTSASFSGMNSQN